MGDWGQARLTGVGMSPFNELTEAVRLCSWRVGRATVVGDRSVMLKGVCG
jgi:hypothetical protein